MRGSWPGSGFESDWVCMLYPFYHSGRKRCNEVVKRGHIWAAAVAGKGVKIGNEVVKRCKFQEICKSCKIHLLAHGRTMGGGRKVVKVVKWL